MAKLGRSPRAFTLVEISLALGLAGFALMAVLGALPAGLRAVREAQSQEIAANIAQRLQASLQPISFVAGTSGVNITNLAASTHFYTEDGVETADPASGDHSSPPAFYKAVFAVNNALFDNGAGAVSATAAAQPVNARSVTMTLYYPQSGTAVGKRKFVYPFLIARQGTE